jgi:hypothetical protein
MEGRGVARRIAVSGSTRMSNAEIEPHCLFGTYGRTYGPVHQGEQMKKHAVCGIVFIFLLLAQSLAQDASLQSGELIKKQNIAKARARLGDKLLQSAEAVIARHVAAIGGEAALRSIKTLRLNGRSISLGGERPLLRVHKQPGLIRQQAPGSQDYMAGDGQTLWYIGQTGRQQMSQPWTKGLICDRIDGNFLDYTPRGIRYEFLGLEAFETEPTVLYHLKRTFADGYFEELYFDVDSGLLRMIKYQGYDDSCRYFLEYRDIGGILFPHLNMRVFDRLTPPHVFVVDEVKVNESYPDSFFEKAQ